MASVRTLDFLPEIFKTNSNDQFLSATLDQLVNQPDYQRVEGYIGSKFGYGVHRNDTYIPEINKTRRDYQFEPAVVIKDTTTNDIQSVVTYPEIIDALSSQGGFTDNNIPLFRNQYYSWDSYCDLDKLINYTQYYWLPNGPEAVLVTTETPYKHLDYVVKSNANDYSFSANKIVVPGENPTITLVRGGVYHFNINQESNFYIQTKPGITGYDDVRKNYSTREIYGLDGNGTNSGIITFEVPTSDAQDGFKYSGDVQVDVVSTLKFDELNGKRVSDLVSLDGLTSLKNKTVLFYGHQPKDVGYVSTFFGSTTYNATSFQNSIKSVINQHTYLITYVGDPADPIIRLIENSVIPDNQKISITYGDEFSTRNFVKNSVGEIILIPIFTSSLDTLYYQDSANPYKVGKIKIVEPTNQFNIDVEQEILGQVNYTTKVGGIKFTNGLKVQFIGDIYPTTYIGKYFYVEGVGTSINLVPVDELTVPETYGQSYQNPFDVPAYSGETYDSATNIPKLQDYLTINRNAINRNSWSRSNRWFHIDVLNTTIANTVNAPNAMAALSDISARAKRPIIEFYPNLRLFKSGTINKKPIDYVNFDVTDAFNEVAGQTTFRPDGQYSSLFDGARIVFANDNDPTVRKTIYVANFINVDGSNVITLSKAFDGDSQIDEQTVVMNGTNYIGATIYFDGYNWLLGQVKSSVNQAPRFDLFDSNGISFGNLDYYNGSDFNGCTLFEYTPSTNANDPILGFPITYSNVDNVGDINFSVTINTDSFNFVYNNVATSQPLNFGYVYDYSSRADFTRKLSWQTAIEDSFQYQIFNVNSGIAPKSTFTIDVKVKDQTATNFPNLVIYVDNSRIDNTVESAYSYTYTTTNTTTTITISPALGTNIPVTIKAYSDQVTSTGYYEIPSNLDHNPLNREITTLHLGDIRGHYKSICNNLQGKLKGIAFGPNNYRDLGNVIPYGTRIIQNSASAATTAMLMRNSQLNMFDALAFNALEYVKYKNLIVDTVNNIDFDVLQSDADILDTVMEEITSVKMNDMSFFWSDMIPCKNASVVNSYTFAIGIVNAVFNLSRVYSFAVANYFSVLVYVTRADKNGNPKQVQLMRDIDYVVSETEAKLVITSELMDGDTVEIREYYQTYGNFVPNTPTKIGMYPAFIPEIVLDTSYQVPTYFIKGHDGSYNKLYGTYDGTLKDFRDRALFEFENRVYNNLKVVAKIPIEYDDLVPGQFRKTEYTLEQLREMYSIQFLNWVGLNRVDYQSQNYIPSNEFSWNYGNAVSKQDGKKFNRANWRGIYLWYYDCVDPSSTPWEMLGFVNQPSWWDARYGEAPYTSENTVLWTDIANGYVYNDGNPYINEKRVRPGLLDILPVDTEGNLVSPFVSLVQAYDTSTFNATWNYGDMGPAEYSYYKSSQWPFDLMRLFSLTYPAKFFTMGLDLDVYRYNTEFNQYLVYDRLRNGATIQSNVFYGLDDTAASHSIFNWVVDYAQQYGIDGNDVVTKIFNGTGVQLAYRLAGFSDKTQLRFYVEKSSPNSKSSSLLIPDDSYNILLHNNQAKDSITYSSVIIQKTTSGFKVYGNSQNKAYFNVLVAKVNGNYDIITVNNKTVNVLKDHTATSKIIPYGTEFVSIEEIAQFLKDYGAFLINAGFVFDDIENSVELNWNQMIAELLYWTNSDWEVGSTVNINPCANIIKINKDNYVVQPLSLKQQNYILNQNLVPIQLKDLEIYRNGTTFTAKPLNSGDSVSYFTGNISNIEHIVVFDNDTVFNDTIFDSITGLRQERLKVSGTKTAVWDGTMTAAGFMFNDPSTVKDWKPNVKYVKGDMVKYKNAYYLANEPTILPSIKFDPTLWLLTPYDKISKGILPNPSTKSAEALSYYDIHRGNLESDGDLLGYSLIGYRPRDYLATASLDDVAQVNIYNNMLGTKGSNLGSNILNGATILDNTVKYDIYENWAIKSGEFGGILNENYVEVNLDSTQLLGNPSILGIIQNKSVDGVEQSVPLTNIKNYGRSINTNKVLPTVTGALTENLPTAGYVHLDDVVATGYTIPGLSANVDINSVYKNDFVWVANHLAQWNVYTPLPMEAILYNVSNNLNGTLTLTFTEKHNLTTYDLIGILNFDSRIDGYYEIDSIGDEYSIVVTLDLGVSTTKISGVGTVYKLQSQRVSTSKDIASLPLLNSDYVPNKVWVDQNQDGNWTVYEKKNNYVNQNYNKLDIGTQAYGSSVAYIDGLGYIIGDPATGTVFVNTEVGNAYLNIQTITKPTSSAPETIVDPNGESFTFTNTSAFGHTIIHNDNMVMINDNGSHHGRIYVYRIADLGGSKSLVEEQVIDVPNYPDSGIDGNPADPGGRSFHGNAMALSGDGNWLYANLPTFGTVIPYVKEPDYKYLDSGLVLAHATIVGTNTFIVSGNHSDTLEPGRLISFNDEGYETIYTVITGIYDSTTHNTTYYTLEKFKTTVSSGTSVFGAYINYGIMYFANGLTYSPTTIFQEVDSAAMKFGASIATNYDGSKLFIGAPSYDYGPYMQDTGLVYVYNRVVENIEVQYDARPGLFANFYYGFDPVAPYVDLDGNTFPGSKFYINGVEQRPNQHYVIIANKVLFFNSDALTLNAGDIVTISSGNFKIEQTLTSYDDPEIGPLRPGEQFGYSIACNNTGSEVLVSSPYDVLDPQNEGTVFRFSNEGKLFGTLTGIFAANGMAPDMPAYILLNGYQVTIPIGNAYLMAESINQANITNVMAYVTEDDRLVIRLVQNDLGKKNNKLDLTVFDPTVATLMGLAPWVKSQIIKSPHTNQRALFGYKVAFNELGSIVVSAPANDRKIGTIFDFTDDEDSHNDTVLDNNLTTFEDTFLEAGSVYMYDYIESYQENLNSKGQMGNFIYAQTVNDTATNYGTNPGYGKSLDFNHNRVVIGSPNFTANSNGAGRIVIYKNTTSYTQNWNVYRKPGEVVDIEKIQKLQIYNSINNTDITPLDYFDPIQGKLMGIVRENIDYISSYDPAGYNIPGIYEGNMAWAESMVGKIWFDISNVRYLNYHQEDIVYNSKYWARAFPGSDIAVYSWVESDVTPVNYAGPGTVFDPAKYSTAYINDSNNNLVTRYYYWVRNTNKINSVQDKTLSDTIIEQYLGNPQATGVAYLAGLSSSVYGLYNTDMYIEGNDSNLFMEFSSGTSDSIGHQEFKLIRAGYENDFLPGFPDKLRGFVDPEGLYSKLLDSLSGIDLYGNTVPDPFLPRLVQYGISTRPRQSMFIDRLTALKNYITYVNSVIIQYPINEYGSIPFLSASGPSFNTPDFWQNTYWWATGYDSKTKTAYEVSNYAALNSITNLKEGLTIGVTDNGSGNREVHVYTNGNWVRVGAQNGTLQFSNWLYEYRTIGSGYGNSFYANNAYDAYPNQETYNVIRAINEQIFTGTLLEYRNKSLIVLFEYVQSEVASNGNYIPWLTKTSLADVVYTVRPLEQSPNYQSDNTTFLEGYIEEVKPYRVVIKEFVQVYNKLETYTGNITDFDIASKWDKSSGAFISPQLVYQNNDNQRKFLPTDSIWATPDYSHWFNNNGLSIATEPFVDAARTTSYLSRVGLSVSVDNVYGLPVVGVILMNLELIGYNGIDYNTNSLTGLSRGLYGTTQVEHHVNSTVYTDIPGATVLYSGKYYQDVPHVSAYVDTTKYPAPTREAVLQATIGGDKVISVNIIDPGEGYVTTPEIVVDDAIVFQFTDLDIDFIGNSILIQSIYIDTGDLLKLTNLSENMITSDGFYYVHLTASFSAMAAEVNNGAPVLAGPNNLVTLHKTYQDAITGLHPVKLSPDGTSNNSYKLSHTARVVPGMINSRVRGLNTKLRFDRTSYRPLVKTWTSGEYYSSPFVDLTSTSSRADSLYYTQGYQVSQDSTSGTGTGATFEVYSINFGGFYNAAVLNSGSGYAVGDTVTINGTHLGASQATTPSDYNCTLTVQSISYSKTQLAPNTTTGVGTGAYFDVTHNGTAYTATLSPGYITSGYAHGDTMVIYGSRLNGTHPTNDLTITVSTVNSSGKILTIGVTPSSVPSTKAGISTITVSGTSYTTYRASTEGVQLPVLTSSDINGNVAITIDYSNTDITPGQLDHRGVYLYRYFAPYIYDDTGKNFVGRISSTTLTVTQIVNGTLQVGDSVHGIGIIPGTYISAFGSGSGGTGTYTINFSHDLTSRNMNTSGGAKIEIHRPSFNIYSITAQYAIRILNAGTIYSPSDVITVSGSLLGGIDNVNNLSIFVKQVDENNSIYLYDLQGISARSFDTYYTKALNDLQLELYYDPMLNNPVPSLNFMYTGTNGGHNDYLFAPTPLTGQSMYDTNVTSYVSYQNQIWRCTQSNNDVQFDIDKWELIFSDDRNLNALDRIVGYYAPSSSMVAKDLYQLVDGITYPDNVYYGGSFAPEDNLPLDYLVKDPQFFNRNIDVTSIVYDGEYYIAVANGANETVLMVGTDGINWNIMLLANQNINATDITYSSVFRQYVVTTNTNHTPVYISFDREHWNTVGSPLLYDGVSYSGSPYDDSTVTLPENLPLNAVATYGGDIYAVGAKIYHSVNGIVYDTAFDFSSQLNNQLNGIAYVNSAHFIGFIAVGVGDEVVSGADTPIPVIQTYGRIVTMTGGPWTLLKPNITTYALNTVTNNNNLIVVAGDHASIYYSINASNWGVGHITSGSSTDSIRSSAYGYSTFVLVGDNGLVLTSADGISYSVRSSGTTESLNKVVYTGTYFYATGSNGVIIRSYNGITWTPVAEQAYTQPDYVVQGNDFLHGYGPEEMVAGVVTDTLSMRVRTSPGSYWDMDQYTQTFYYGYTGFAMNSGVFKPDNSNTISFNALTSNPAVISVFILEDDAMVGRRIYDNFSAPSWSVDSPEQANYYTVDWINRTITLANTIDKNTQSILIEAYEVGDGRQLIRSNNKETPLRADPVTGNSYFVFDFAYQPIITDPSTDRENIVVYVNGEKMAYQTDYYLDYDAETGNMILGFADPYDDATTYITFAILTSSITAENLDNQFFYSIPETQLFHVNESMVFELTGYLGDDNIANAIVEFQGKRLLNTESTTYYVIDPDAKTLTIQGYSYDTDHPDDVVAITTYNSTARQWLTTQYSTTLEVKEIVAIDNAVTPVKVTLASNTTFSDGDIVRLKGLNGAHELENNTYYAQIDSINHNIVYLYNDIDFRLPVHGYEVSHYVNEGYMWVDAQSLVVVSPDTPGDLPSIVYTDGSRTWVTVNGSRLAPESVKFGSDNKLYILSAINYDDVVMVTTMVTGETPTETEFNLTVDKANKMSVYRSNPADKTWLTVDLYPTDLYIHFYDVTQILESMDSVSGVVEINGERISFSSVDLVANTVSELIRGVQGTPVVQHYKYDRAFGINNSKKLNEKFYNQEWTTRSFDINATDPLQISSSEPAYFLNNRSF